MAGHGGTKFLRRMMGIVSVWDFTSIKDLEKRAVAERLAIRIGTRWVMERKTVTSIDDLIGMVQEEASGGAAVIGDPGTDLPNIERSTRPHTTIWEPHHEKDPEQTGGFCA